MLGPVIDRLLGRLVSRSFRRGLAGEPVFLVLGAAAWLVVRSRKQRAPGRLVGDLERGRQAGSRRISGGRDRATTSPDDRRWNPPPAPKVNNRLLASRCRGRLLSAGEQVLVIDHKGRRYLVRLQDGGAFHTHAGILSHDSIIGMQDGSTVAGSTGRSFVVVRPTLADVVVKMPRGAQVIYPKDIGAILLAADAGPGMSVLEAGVGSGALSMALIRAGCVVVGYELREDFAESGNCQRDCVGRGREQLREIPGGDP